MKKFIIIIFAMVLVAAIVVVAIFFGPSESKAKWLTASFTETLKEKNELIVYINFKRMLFFVKKVYPVA